METCCSMAAAAVGSALMLSLASCYVAKTIMHGRKHMAQTQLEMAKVAAQGEIDLVKVKAHTERLNRQLGSVLPAWPVLLLLMGGACSGGLLALSQREQVDLMAANKPTKPDPTHKNCTNCPVRCKCMGGKCDCPAQTEDEKRRGIRADVSIPPNTDVGISAFGHPWARSTDRL